jgi:hypothetical protein
MPIPNTADAVYPAQAEPDSRDFDIISAAHSGTGVLSGCACTPGNSGVNLSVAVASGVVYVASKTSVAVTGATVTPGAASGANPRLDLVVADNTGALSVVAGAAAVAPVFPAIPANRVVLCAVWIPTSASSITASNIIDKRQMVNYVPGTGTVTDAQVATANIDGTVSTPSMRTLGTGAQMAASGNHIHDGAYASTAHAATHDGATGSDPITTLGNFGLSGDITQTVSDGTSMFVWQGQTADPGAVPSDSYLGLWADWHTFTTRLSLRTIDQRYLFGTVAMGPDQYTMTPSTGAAGLLSPMIPKTDQGTLATSAASSTLPRRTQYRTAASTGAQAAVYTTDLCVMAGGGELLPWNGLHLFARIVLPDASYANSGATTGTRIFVGVTDQAYTVICNSDDPAGHRAGFFYRNVNGGTTNTTWRREEKDGATRAEDDTGITVTQNHVYDMYVYLRRNIAYVGFQLDDLTNGTSMVSQIDGRNAPGVTTLMRPMICIQTINAVARNIEIARFGWETI